MYCLNLKAEEKEAYNSPIDAERLLRSLGASGRLVGFKFMVFIVEKLLENPNEWQWLTKGVYLDTGKHFNVSSYSVERGIRGLVNSCWKREDHETLNYVAGVTLERRPTNAEFIDMLVAFLRYKNNTALLKPSVIPAEPDRGSGTEDKPAE